MMIGVGVVNLIHFENGTSDKKMATSHLIVHVTLVQDMIHLICKIALPTLRYFTLGHSRPHDKMKHDYSASLLIVDRTRTV